ncbi:MAG TPA: tetratricopeptide repeat protein, partial [Acidobacteriota bacterium]|nr:tetratricopeptide repeat protein [Acidobacteriota bacterium]
MGQGSIPKSINFDQYQRYHFIERVIDAFAGDLKLRVLEVGGAFSSALQHLSDKHQICIADSIQAPDIQLRANGEHLPFAEKSFDVVVCTDVLEHVPSELRKPLIRELQRVTSGILILGFPNNTPEAKAADQILSDWIREMRGDDYAFLSEHSKYGLPDASQIRGVLRETEGTILEAMNANVYSWLPLMMSYFAIEKHAEFEGAKKVLNELFNSNYDAASHTPPAYRTFFIWFSVSYDDTTFHNVKQALGNSEGTVHDFAFSSLALSLSFERALRRVQEIADLRLNQYNESRTEVEAVKKSSTELEAHLKSLDREIVLLQDHRTELMKKVDSVGEELKLRAERMKQQDSTIEELEKKAAVLHGTIERQRQVIEEREKRIQSLNRELGEAHRIQHETVEESDKQLAGLRMQLRNTIREHDHQIAGLKNELHHTQQYLNLFLNHPVYKAYKLFKRKPAIETVLESLPEQKQEQPPKADSEDDTESVLNRADHFFSSNDLEGAVQLYRKVTASQNRNERAIAGLVRILQARGEFEEAQHILNSSLNRDPGSITLLLLLAGS